MNTDINWYVWYVVFIPTYTSIFIITGHFPYTYVPLIAYIVS